MSNKDNIRRAFSAVCLPEQTLQKMEDQRIMKKTENRMKIRKAIAGLSAAAAVCIGGVTCYAADVGGIQRTIQVWFHGDQTSAVITVDSESGISKWDIQDEDGNTIQSGGGIAIEDDGSERPLSVDEIQEMMDDRLQRETVDGRTYLYYKDQVLDITDKFDDDGLCYVTIEDGRKKLYVTVTNNGGISTSYDRYVQKDEMPPQWFEDNN